MHFDVLGPLAVSRDGTPLSLGSAKQRTLLAALILHPNEPVSSAALTEIIWDDDPPLSAPANLRTYARGLRQVLGEDRIPSSSGGYLLRVAPGERDLDRFDAATARGRAAVGADDPEGAVALFAEAVGMWRGTPALSDLAHTPALARMLAPLEDRRLLVEEEYAEALLATGAPASAIVRLRELLSQYPLRQRAWRTLMLALYRTGDVAGALAAYREAHDVLAEETGLDPGPELARLHTAILNQDPDLHEVMPVRREALVAPEAPTALDLDIRPEQLPAAPWGFVGREAELESLEKLLTGSDEAAGSRIIAISGMAGVGKTTLGLQWAHRVASRFPDGRLYANLRGFDRGDTVAPTDALLGFLESLGVPQDRIPAGIDARTALFRSILAGRRMLVFLDNALDEQHVSPLLPGAGGSAAVITSRHSLDSLAASQGAKVITLGELSDSEAATLLADRLGPARVSEEPEAVNALVNAAGRLPLALSLAAARISHLPGFSLGDFVAELDTDGAGLSGLDALAGGEVRHIFSWSYESLSPDAARLFRLLGLHPGPDFTSAAAAALGDLPRSRLSPLLHELTAANLVTEHRPFRWAFHDLLRRYAAELAEASHSAEELHAARTRLYDLYLHLAYPAAKLVQPQWIIPEPLAQLNTTAGKPPTDSDSALIWLENEREVLTNVAHDASRTGHDSYAWQLAWALTAYLAPRGLWHEQRDVHTFALEAAERTGELAGLATAHRMLGLPNARLGDIDVAESHLRTALELYREAGDIAGLAQTHHSLSEVVFLQDRVDDAIHHVNEAVALYRQVGNEAAEARTQNIIGYLKASTGDFDGAIESCTAALDYQQRTGDRNGQAATLDSLGFAYAGLGKHREAIVFFERAVEMFRASSDLYHEGETMIKLGDSHRALDEPEAAADAWHRAVAAYEPFTKQVAERLAALPAHRIPPDRR